MNLSISVQNRASPVCVRNSNLSRLHKICTRQNCYPNFPLLKVLEILKNFFQEVFKQGLGQSPKVLTIEGGTNEHIR